MEENNNQVNEPVVTNPTIDNQASVVGTVAPVVQAPTVENAAPVVPEVAPAVVEQTTPVVENATPVVPVAPVVETSVPQETSVPTEVTLAPDQPATTETAPVTDQPTATEETPKEEKKKPNIILIAALVAAVVLIGVGVCFALGIFGGEKKEEKPKEEIKPPVVNPQKDENKIENVEVNIDTTPRSGVTAKDFNGIYQSGTTTLKVYAIRDDYILFDLNSTSTGVQGYAEYGDDKISGTVFIMYTFELYNEGIGLETDNEEITERTFKKMKDYTINDYYADYYGDEAYLDSDYNGLFKSDKCEFYSYQADKEKVFYEAVCSKDTADEYGYGGYLELDGSKPLEDSFFEEKKTFDFNGDSLTIVATGESNQQLSGTYQRTKKLTIQEIIDHIQR